MKKIFLFFCIAASHLLVAQTDLFLKNIPDISLPLSHLSFFEGMTKELDTLTVRKLQLIGPATAFDMPESWVALGKISTKSWTALLYNYSNESTDNRTLVIYDLSGKKIASVDLQVNMAYHDDGIYYTTYDIYEDHSIELGLYSPAPLEKNGVRKYRIEENGEIVVLSEQWVPVNHNEGHPVLKKATLPCHFTAANMVVFPSQAEVDRIHKNDEDLENYGISWIPFIMNNQAALVNEPVPDENTRYVFGVADIYREPFYTATVYVYYQPARGNLVYYLTTFSTGSEGKVVDKVVIFNPADFSVPENSSFSPDITFYEDYRFTITIAPGATQPAKEYTIDEEGKITCIQ